MGVKGWEKTTIGALGTWSGGLTPSMSNSEYWNGDVFWLSSGDIKQPLLFASPKKITHLALSQTSLRLFPAGTVVIVVRSGILRVYFPVAELQSDMSINQDLKAVVFYAGINSRFVLHLLSYHGDEILRACLKTGTTVESIELDWLKAYEIDLPPLPEQYLIAEALSDADAYISVLEKLLVKKRNIKQGAMQELLTGKKRLPGFSEKWDCIEIGENFYLFAGGDVNTECFSRVRTSSHQYVVYANALLNYGLYGFTSAPRYSGDSLTITGRGDIGTAMYRKEEFDAIVRLLVLTPKQKNTVDSRFVTYLINTCVEFSQEITGVPQLTVPQIRHIELCLPKYNEQTAIAGVISDMDEEINKLENKLQKARWIKQGMMSQLLTGNIRLVEEGADNG